MKALRGLIAFFSLVFLLSAISLLLLIIDDQKDLSSRASTIALKTNTPALESFDGAEQSPKPVTKDWTLLEDNFFLNHTNGDTLRIVDSKFNSASFSAILGKDFSLVKKTTTESVGNVAVEKHIFTFFGQNKKVNLWKVETGSLLEVGAESNDSSQTIEFIQNYFPESQVLAATTPDSSAKLATTVRPSVVMVLNHYCAELKFISLPDFPLSDKAYPFCLTSVGSGFFISSDGLLATNGHIVRNLPKSSLYYALSSGKIDKLIIDFLGVYFAQRGQAQSPELITQKLEDSKKNKESLYQIGGIVLDLTQKNILKFQNETNKYFLQLGNEPATLTEKGVETSDSVVTATLLDIDYEEINESTGFTSSDVAVLKAASGNYPGLPLGEITDALVGSEIQVIGFPIAATNNNLLIDSTSLTEPTFTRGLVSAVKLAKGNQKKLIQTDAIINHGNSGGPAVLQNGQVAGIATYGVVVEDGSGSYNYLRDVQDVKDILKKNSLQQSQGEVYNLWQSGLNSYWINYYAQSAESFIRLKEIYPAHPLVDRYLQDSLSKKGTLEDKTPALSYKQRQIFIYTSGASMLISFLSVIVLIIIQKRQKDNSLMPTVPQF